jgi:hypothetical protein
VVSGPVSYAVNKQLLTHRNPFTIDVTSFGLNGFDWIGITEQSDCSDLARMWQSSTPNITSRTPAIPLDPSAVPITGAPFAIQVRSYINVSSVKNTAQFKANMSAPWYHHKLLLSLLGPGGPNRTSVTQNGQYISGAFPNGTAKAGGLNPQCLENPLSRKYYICVRMSSKYCAPVMTILLQRLKMYAVLVDPK